MLTIKNYERINNARITPNGSIVWMVVGMEEVDEYYYKITLMPNATGVAFSIHKSEYVYLDRSLRDNGFEYNITHSGNVYPIHCQYLKSPDKLLEWISAKILCKL